MKNTKHSAIGNGRRNLFTFFITLIMVVGFVAVSWAQPRFTRTTFNAAYTPITTGGGATSSIVTGNDNNQTEFRSASVLVMATVLLQQLD